MLPGLNMALNFAISPPPSILLVSLQNLARRRLPTFRLIFVHVLEMMVFVPVGFIPLTAVHILVQFLLFSFLCPAPLRCQ